MTTSLRDLPAIHRLLERPALRRAAARHGRTPVLAACRAEVDRVRSELAAAARGDDAGVPDLATLERRILALLDDTTRDAYPEVLNATGVLIHTNLGRAPLAAGGLPSPGSYLALELDLAGGGRGQRLAPLRDRAAAVCGAETAVVVNNNAAALVLILSGLARGREVIVSRGQLIEIGGSFRLPDVMAASGARLVEVGCTNRTHLRDYEAAIGADTAAILVAHQSNYRIVGFTAEPPLAELAELARRHSLPLIVDQGSGCLHDLGRWGLPHEATVAELLAAGADPVCFSGDKLLGGPQAGIIVGSARRVAALGRHPLYRALRPDKTTLVGLDRVLRAHSAGRLDEIPLYRMLATPLEALQRRARSLVRRLRAADVPARSGATRAVLGGGTTPGESLPSWGLLIGGDQDLLAALRRSDPSVIGRLEGGDAVLDLRTVPREHDRTLAEAVAVAYSRHTGGR